MKDVLNKIYDYTLEEIMGDRYGRYAKYIIQDRAIPDVRDGLKPVQRRILYSMYREKNTFDKPYRKCAKTVGDVIGNYHPHGDFSIYDAMVHMSQSWKVKNPYIDMHGNNGSIDGDSPAAYRYTEARLSKISNELLKDIDKNTVTWAPNFDDTRMEPTVLPAKFPNLLVNGATGISSGYATNIPPHNLGEVIDATIKRIDSPNCTLESIMQFVKGPDFPTGGIVEGIDGITSAYKTGKGKVIIKSRTAFEDAKGKVVLAVSEIPFGVNKAALVREIDEIRMDKKIDGILEVRDESDRDGLRIAIDLKKDCNKEVVLNYLLKNTELQIAYSFNMIVIVNRCPKQLGILPILDAYIAHQKDVILKRTKFDLDFAKERLEIVDGLVKCLSILDEVIKVIRASKNKANAIENLMTTFGFTQKQADAIVTLQLYRLTNTDVVELEEEQKRLLLIIKGLQEVLENEATLKNVMKEELRKIKKEYAEPRKTDIKEQITEIKIDSKEMITKEDVIVTITKDGYVKRTSLRSYQASDEEITLKDNDYLLGFYELNTLDVVLLFTSKGNYLYLPVHEIPTAVWKDLGKHVSNIIKLDENEEIISVVPVTSFQKETDITIATRDGMIKRTLLKEFETTRYSKPITCMKLKEDDRVIAAFETTQQDIFIATEKAYGLWFDVSDVPVVGLKASGVKSMNLKEDAIVSVSSFDENKLEYISIITENGTGKRVRLSEFEKLSRAKRGLMILREVKTNPYRICKAVTIDSKEMIGLKGDSIEFMKMTELPIMDRYSTGSQISKKKIKEVFEYKTLVTKKMMNEKEKEPLLEEKPTEKKEVSLKEIDERLMTIDDFLKEK